MICDKIFYLNTHNNIKSNNYIMGCSGNNNTQTNEEHRENMNQMKNLANQQMNAAK